MAGFDLDRFVRALIADGQEERCRRGKLIISHRHKFIFLKTRKTAGTSLEIGLSEHCGSDDIITAISPEDEEIRRKIGFRGPQNHLFDEVVSQRLRPAGAGRKQLRELVNHDTAATVRAFVGDAVWESYFKFTIERDPFDKALSRYWWLQRGDSTVPFSDFLRNANPEKMSNWHIYTIDGRIAVDRVLRFEALAAEIEWLRDRLDLPHIKMVHAKSHFRNDRRHYAEVLSADDRQRIESLCVREMVAFGYAWSDGTSETMFS